MAKKNKSNPAQNPLTQPGTQVMSQGNTKTKTTSYSKSGGINTAGLTPEQVTQLQLEEAIKESQNPSMKLKKLRSPLSVRGCILNIVLFVVLTLVCVFLYIRFFKVTNFDLWYITKDMLQEFGITDFFKNIFTAIGNFFRGKKGDEATEIIKFFIR